MAAFAVLLAKFSISVSFWPDAWTFKYFLQFAFCLLNSCNCQLLNLAFYLNNVIALNQMMSVRFWMSGSSFFRETMLCYCLCV